MKKILFLIMALMIVPVCVFADFSDVPENHWAYECINELKEAGVVDGYEDGSFRPEGFVTRAETARILCDIAHLPEGDGKYPDISEDDWYYTYARDCGRFIVNGDVFGGNIPITREEFAKAVVLIKGIEADEDSAGDFSDYETIKEPLYVSSAVEAGFVSGYEDGTFRPEGNVTRAEVCSMLSRAFRKVEPDLPDGADLEKTWSLKKIANADIENFSTDAVLGYYNELIFLEDEVDEILFRINLADEEIKRETMWRFPAFVLRTDTENEEVGYSDFKPLFYDNESMKTLVFGRFTGYKDESGTVYSVNKYCGLDITYRLFDYAQFEEGMVQYEDKETCIPELLYVHNEKHSVVYDGKSSVYRFRLENGIREGRLYYGKPDTYRGFLSIGDRMFGVDGGFNLKEYDFENLQWKEKLHTFDADFMGIRENKFWLWDAVGGRIYKSTPDGKETTVHEDVSVLNVDIEEGINTDKLDGHMLVYDEDSFILYDGTAFLMLEKK